MARRSKQRGVVELHYGSWTVRYRERDWATGKWTERRKNLEDCQDFNSARLAADQFLQSVNEYNSAKRLVAPAVVTFSDFVSGQWAEYCKSRRHARSTLDCYNSLMKNHFLPFFGGMDIKTIMPADVTRFFNRYRSNYPDRPMAMLYSVLKVMFGVADDYDLIERSPVRAKRHRPEDDEREERISFDPQTIRKIIDVSPDDLRLFILVMSITGVRLNECRAFRWCDLDEGGANLDVSHSLYCNELKAPKTKASRKPIPLPEPVVLLLVDWRDRSVFAGAENFIFCDESGRPRSRDWLYGALYEAMDKVGLKRKARAFGFHAFRHSAGTILYEATRDLKLVQRALRHSKLQTTADIYLHPDDSIMREATETLTREILPVCDRNATGSKRRTG